MAAQTRTGTEQFAKAATGILGFEAMTGGGLPQGRTTLLAGGPGSGKTIFAAQFLMHGAMACEEPGIFVAFEEVPHRIVSNLGAFGWPLAELQPEKLYFIDAQPGPDLIQSGEFDLAGMLAAIGAQVSAMGARRIVFDALDIVLALLPDQACVRREIYRLHDWLLKNELTGLVTAKCGGGEAGSLDQQPFGCMQFIVDCYVVLNHRVALGISQRSLRIEKYRGCAFDENESPFMVGASGFDVAVVHKPGCESGKATSERITSGVVRLDTMLGGGYFRGASVLITGFPGTAKTTLGGAFAQAACERGERTLFISFDSDGSEVIRNLTSVGIRLDRHVASGILRMICGRTMNGSAEHLLVRTRSLAKEHKATCLVMDPVSALSRPGNELAAQRLTERLIDWTKADGITMVCTSVLDEMAAEVTSRAPLPISALVDTWIHLNHLMQAGERNRGVSIIKSRGTAHSNQVHDLILSDEGVTLADRVPTAA
ncbi:MAG: circadian clock protein KaiC [Burkholderiaceae bacterium]|nr:circadian clock protein KaiC [Burkholderiaceae bacterium]MDO9090949.1 circadian clock protein KaiC [Burkholderiaceae bacterium]